MKINLYRNVDKIIGSILCAAIGLWPKTPTIPTPKKILITKLWAIGESVLTLPMIDAIKSKKPSAEITVLARKRNKAVYEGQPFITNIIIFEPANLLQLLRLFKKFDVAIDGEPYLNISALAGRWLAKKQVGFNHGIRAKMYDQKTEYNDQQHVVKTYLDLGKLIGIKQTKDELITLKYTKDDTNVVEELLKKERITKKDFIVGMCQSVAESGKNRMWPTENYAKVADELMEKYNAKIILVGTKSDYENNNEIIRVAKYSRQIINLAGKTTLKQLFYLATRCKLFISNDTGPMHIAAAQGTQTIGIFGPNLPLRFAPYGKKNISLYAQQYCSPCINVHKGSFPECYNKIKGKCLKEITPTMVMGAVKKCKTP